MWSCQSGWRSTDHYPLPYCKPYDIGTGYGELSTSRTDPPYGSSPFENVPEEDPPTPILQCPDCFFASAHVHPCTDSAYTGFAYASNHTSSHFPIFICFPILFLRNSNSGITLEFDFIRLKHMGNTNFPIKGKSCYVTRTGTEFRFPRVAEDKELFYQFQRHCRYVLLHVIFLFWV